MSPAAVPAPVASPANDDDAIDLLEYWRVLRDRRWTIAAVTGVVLVLALAATLLATPIFRASSTLQIERDTMKIMDVEGITPAESPMDRDFYQTQSIIRSVRSAHGTARARLSLPGHAVLGLIEATIRFALDHEQLSQGAANAMRVALDELGVVEH